MRWQFWKTQPPQRGPHGGEPPLQCDATPVQRAELALAGLEEAWARAADAPQRGELVGARELAVEFRRLLRERPALVGMGISSKWIRGAYPLFARAHGVGPPFKDFAKQLALLMPRRRADVREGGKRVGTATFYHVSAPTSVVVELAVERKRA